MNQDSLLVQQAKHYKHFVHLLHEVDGDVRGDPISGAQPQVGLVSPCPRKSTWSGHGNGVAAPTTHLGEMSSRNNHLIFFAKMFHFWHRGIHYFIHIHYTTQLLKLI